MDFFTSNIFEKKFICISRISWEQCFIKFFSFAKVLPQNWKLEVQKVCDVFSVRNKLTETVTQSIYYNSLFFFVPNFLYKFPATFFCVQRNKVF